MRTSVRQRPAFYRSTLIRWVFVVTGIGVAVTVSPWSPHDWHNSASLEYLHRVIPWPVMFATVCVYVLLLVSNRLPMVIAGDFLGMFVYGGDLYAIAATAHGPGNPVNGLAFAAFLLATVLHYGAGRLAYLDLEGRRHRERIG